jgi:hypothetical protein
MVCVRLGTNEFYEFDSLAEAVEAAQTFVPCDDGKRCRGAHTVAALDGNKFRVIGAGTVTTAPAAALLHAPVVRRSHHSSTGAELVVIACPHCELWHQHRAADVGAVRAGPCGQGLYRIVTGHP